MSEGLHRIRLRGPWNVQRVVRGRRGEITVSHFPATWRALSGGDRGTFRFSRRFGCPTGVGPLQVVWLEIASSAAGRAVLNENDLGEISQGSQCFDVTSRLGDGNQLELELHRPEDVGADDVVLEAAILIGTHLEASTPRPTDLPPWP